ncbi:hypothetical protein NDU88_002567 [Pleurodeles waltl]|uniref:Uncharacterized protein n=1 Tax=Pleurodeles waltl TaxID=8319 RepID=A0AAV7SAS5_PLEWA|nr:hypothetical protein NDU88_002567 [Pleurodeles waltl]
MGGPRGLESVAPVEGGIQDTQEQVSLCLLLGEEQPATNHRVRGARSGEQAQVQSEWCDWRPRATRRRNKPFCKAPRALPLWEKVNK